MKDDKKSILKEAIADLNEIKEAADVNAKKKLAEEFPEKFNELLKNELNQKKESYKKIDENKESELVDDNNNEKKENDNSVMKETKTIKKGPVGDGKPFAKKIKNEEVESTKPIEEVVGDGKPFDKKVNKSLQTEEFDITELDNSMVGSAIENADNEDQFLTLDEIEKEINDMENLDGELDAIESGEETEEPVETTNEIDIDELKEIKEKIDNIIQSLEGNVGGSEEELEPETDEFSGEEMETEVEPEEEMEEGVLDFLKSKNLEELNPNDPKDQQTIKQKFLNTFNTSIRQFTQVREAVKGIGFDEMLSLLIQNKEAGANGGALGVGKMGLGIRPKNVSWAGKSRSRLGEENVNEIFGFSVKDKFSKLDPNDEAGVIKLFNAAFGDILMNPKMGIINRIASKTSIPEKYELLRQYVEGNGGTLRIGNDNKLTLGSQQLKDKSTTFAAKGRNRLGEEQYMENEQPITDEEIDAILNSDDETEEPEMDEAHGVSYGERRKMTGRHNPGNEYLSSMEKDQAPYVQESKKVSALIEENKKLTKKLNEAKKYKNSVSTLVENYKSVIGKCREQLKEMTIFNTNLSNVNNLLVNEELALTHDDKIKIINEFKSIDKISVSQEKYKVMLAEMKNSKKTLSENIEDKVSADSIQPSSKENLNEVIQKTAYENNEHIDRMRKLMNYGGKK
jgi:hypothetical protein